jgi:hypothetical protein
MTALLERARERTRSPIAGASRARTLASDAESARGRRRHSPLDRPFAGASN